MIGRSGGNSYAISLLISCTLPVGCLFISAYTDRHKNPCDDFAVHQWGHERRSVHNASRLSLSCNGVNQGRPDTIKHIRIRLQWFLRDLVTVRNKSPTQAQTQFTFLLCAKSTTG